MIAIAEEIVIENGKKHHCPQCHSLYAISNNHEILYRRILLLRVENDKKVYTVICKQCKKTIEVNEDEIFK